MTPELQSTLEASGIERPELRNHIPCMAQIIQLALGDFMSCLGVKGRTNSWEAHECDQQFGDIESIDIGNTRRLRKEGYARINKVSARRPGLAKIIEKISNSIYFKSPDTDLYIAENACGIDYAGTWSLKRVYLLLKSQSTNCSTIYYGCEDTVEFDTAVAWASLPIRRMDPRVAERFKIHQLLATLQNTGWMDYR